MFIDLLPPVITLSTKSTSITVNLSHVNESLLPDRYTISVAPVTSERQTCQNVDEDITTIKTSGLTVEITDLFEYRLYNLTVEAIHTTSQASNSTSVEFITSTASKFFYLNFFLVFLKLS